MPQTSAAKSSPVKWTDEQLALELSKLRGWKVEGGKLHREYVFADFVAAFGFMASAALVAQAMDLMTHDAAGITVLDVKLAHSMEELALRQPAK